MHGAENGCMYSLIQPNTERVMLQNTTAKYNDAEHVCLEGRRGKEKEKAE